MKWPRRYVTGVGPRGIDLGADCRSVQIVREMTKLLTVGYFDASFAERPISLPGSDRKPTLSFERTIGYLPISVSPHASTVVRGREDDLVDTVLVLNADLGPLHWVSLKHAVCMLFRNVAVVHEAEPDRLFGIYPRPRILRLISYVDTRWRRSARPNWSRSGVLERDGRRCGYCEGHATTVDHIVPRSRGGGNTWTNTVAACDRCNQRKGCRTPIEAGMRLRLEPTAPTWAALIRRWPAGRRGGRPIAA